MLLGGVTGREHPGGHDWYNLLKMTNSLENYAEIAGFAGNLGKVIMFLSFLWGESFYTKYF